MLQHVDLFKLQQHLAKIQDQQAYQVHNVPGGILPLVHRMAPEEC